MSSREELLTYGYIREHHNSNNIELPPTDVILLLVSWITLIDAFDTNKVPRDIQFEDENEARFQRTDTSIEDWVSVVGSYVVQKGSKQLWSFKTIAKAIIIGIMDDELIKSNDEIYDYTLFADGAYGLHILTWDKYQRVCHGSIAKYATQFKLWDFFDDSIVIKISMELDMTQKENKNGILKYIVHNETKKSLSEIRTDGEYTNIAWDDVDIDKKYRLVVAVSQFACGESIELCQFI